MSVEKAILGLCMRDPKNFDVCIGLGIEAQDFGRLGLVFEAMMMANAAGQPLDLPVLGAALPAEMLTELVDIDASAPVSANIEYFVEEFMSKVRLERIKTVCARAVNRLGGRAPFEDVSSVLDEILAVIKPSANSNNSQTKHIRSVLDTFIDETERLFAGDSRIVTTGLPPLDNLLGGFQPGDLIVLAARPGVGKTTLALQFATTVAQQGYNSVFVTMEMTPLQLVQKMVSARGGVCSKRIRNGRLSEEDLDLISAAAIDLSKQPIYITVAAKRDIGLLAQEVRGLKRQGLIDFLVVDYAQLLKADGDWRGNRVQEMAEISGTLKTLALECNIPVVLLSQINREAAKGSGLPGVHHLRDSGSLEQDADAVLILHKESVNEIQSRHLLIIGKNRHGNTAHYELEADLSTSTFRFRE